MKSEATKPAGEHRKDLYMALQEIFGREMTEEEHKKVKTLVQAYLIEHGAALYEGSRPSAPLEHHWICTDCRVKKVAIGKKENMKVVTKAKINNKILKKTGLLD